MHRLPLLLVLILGATALAQEPRPWQFDDLFLAESFHPAAVSPGGEGGVAIRDWIDPETKTERHSLWKTEPMEPGEPDARAPLFSPDGKWIAFLSTRPRPDGWKQTPPAPPQSEATVDLWLIPADGGEAKPLAASGYL